MKVKICTRCGQVGHSASSPECQFQLPPIGKVTGTVKVTKYPPKAKPYKVRDLKINFLFGKI